MVSIGGRESYESEVSEHFGEIAANQLLIPLRAPYNAPVMEVWLASLINRNVVGVDGPWRSPRVYDSFDGELSPVGGEATLILRPDPLQSDPWTTWVSAVDEIFLSVGGAEITPQTLAEAIAEELRGRRSRGSRESARKRNIIASIPLVPASAALQNQWGVVGSTQYNDYDAVVEQAYALGRRGDQDTLDSAGGTLMSALSRVTSKNPLLGNLDAAVALGVLRRIDPTVSRLNEGVWASETAMKPKPERTPHSSVQEVMGTSTPFVWFYESWNTLMSPAWLEALPPRRWVDWSIAVIRLGIGMGLLWINRWYEEIARIAVGDEELPTSDSELLAVLAAKMSRVELLRWPESTESAANRNVKTQFDQSFRRGMNANLTIGDQSLRNQSNEMGMARFLKHMRDDAAIKQQLERALSSNYEGNRSVRNLRYTAMDLLSARVEGHGLEDMEGADHYYLLRKSGRGRGESLHFEPTTETMAVVASLACRTPESPATLGDVARSFSQLGLRPSISELRRHLERAGLSRAVADASLQIEVRSAFGGQSI